LSFTSTDREVIDNGGAQVHGAVDDHGSVDDYGSVDDHVND
jgi:hypothetical protein